MKLTYIQRKDNVANVLWGWGNGLALSHYPNKYVFKGHTIGNTIWICKGDAISLAADETTRFGEIIKEMQEELLKDPDHVTEVRKIFDRKAKKVKSFIKLLQNDKVSKFSNKKLAAYYEKIVDCYKNAYAYGEPIAFVTKDFGDLINFKGSKDEFNILITPPEKTFLQREYESLLKIALSGKKEMIKQHTEKFTWVPYDYGVTNYDEKHYLNELNQILKLKNLKKEYNRLKNYSSSIKAKHKRLYKKYNNQKLFEIVQNSNYLMDYKKEIFTMLHWYSVELFTEIGKRLKLKKEHVQFILPTEMKNLLTGKKKADKSSLEERRKGLVLIIKSNGEVDTLQGKKAEQIVNKFYQDRSQKHDISEVEGRPAYIGKAKGKVRVILDAKKCGELKEGEILVTSMTSPDFMVAVKKASAIVTDEGGITCHAAIVARELKIPCVIGTKIATKVFHDGDLVEVNANHGWVKKIG